MSAKTGKLAAPAKSLADNAEIEPCRVHWVGGRPSPPYCVLSKAEAASVDSAERAERTFG